MRPGSVPSRPRLASAGASVRFIDGHEPSGGTVARLNREWEELSGQPADWLTPSPSLGMVLQSVRFNPDRVLLELVSAQQAGHCLAGRVIIQALLPKLILVSRSYPHPGIDHLLAALWLRIDRYPVARRPSAVAANLVMDARKDTLEESRAAPVISLAPASAGSPADAELTAHSVIATAWQLKLATEESLRIVEEVYLRGLPSGQVAVRHAISRDAVRQRCSDTVRRLRAHREVLAELAQVA